MACRHGGVRADDACCGLLTADGGSLIFIGQSAPTRDDTPTSSLLKSVVKVWRD
jgi:hypothetical protein